MKNLVIAYRNVRLLFALAALVLIVVGAILALLDGASASDIGVPIALVVAVAVVVTLRYARHTKALAADDQYASLVRASMARRAERQREDRLLGSPCAECARTIVMEGDGIHCPTCRAHAHRDCLAAHERKAH